MSTRQLQPPDAHHIKAAQGWLELGNHREANKELAKVATSLHAHPDVLEARFQISAMAEKWEACLDIGAMLVKAAPRKPSSYLHHATALHKLKRTHHARDELLRAVRKFPKNWQVCYDLARYACRLGKLEESRAWLNQAFDLGDQRKLKLMALDELDLEMIWRGF